MSVAATIQSTMQKSGWRPEPTRNPAKVDVRLTFTHPGAFLRLEHHPQQGQLWLWIHSADDKRCLGLPYEKNLDQVLGKIVSMQGRLAIDSYIGEYGELQKVCNAQIVAWEQFQTGADALREEYGVELLFERPFTMNGDAIWRALQKELPQAQRLGDLQFAYAQGGEAQAMLSPQGAPDREKIAPSSQQTWNWPEAWPTVQKCGFSVLATDLVAGGLERVPRLSSFLAFLRAALSVHMPLAIHWVSAQRVVPPQPVQQTPPEQQLGLAVNVRYWSPEPGDHFMDTRGLDVFGLPDIEARYKEFDPGRMANCLWTIAGYLWQNGDIFKENEYINGLSDEPWYVTHEISRVAPTRTVLKVRAGRNYSDK
jgi:hypothetical protein